jgi:hypothetical protein
MLHDWWRLRQNKRNRNRRRYELIRKRLDTTRSTAQGDCRASIQERADVGAPRVAAAAATPRDRRSLVG